MVIDDGEMVKGLVAMIVVCTLAGCGALIGIGDAEVVETDGSSGATSGSSSTAGTSGTASATSGSSSSSSSSSSGASSSSSSGDIDIFGANGFFCCSLPDADAVPGHAGSKVTGQSCIVSGCHGAADKKPFTAAGTVVDANGKGAKAQIGIQTGATQIFIATDPNGNFWTSYELGATNRVGVRTMTDTKVMATPLGAPASCNQGGSCHGGAMGAIHVP